MAYFTEKNKFATMELLANDVLNSDGVPNYSNRDFMNAVLIFQHSLMAKMWELQRAEKMPMDVSAEMANKCGENLRKLIKTYTDLDMHEVENFI
jgi:hypothetical protein